MKTYPDRLWLVLLGVAVAILVMLTTIFWTPTQARSGATMNPSKPTAQSLAPRIGNELVKFFRKTSLKSPVRH
jgi:hypothetical protein